MKASRYIFRWHHWCGLIVGIFLLLMSISGSILAFADEIAAAEESQAPAPVQAAGTPNFDASLSTVLQQFPGWEIRLYHMPAKDKALIWELRKKEQSKKIFAHPVTGEILGIREDANRSIQRQLLLFHYTLLSGTTGKIIVFFNGVLFLITLITGAIVYRRSFRKVFSFRAKVNRKTTRSYYSSLHRIIGVWALAFNLLLVSTGLWLSGKIAKAALKPAAVVSAPARVASVDDVVEIIHRTRPDFEIHLLRIRPGSSVVQATGRLRSDPAVYGNFYSSFSVDPANSSIQSSSFMKDLPAGQKISNMAGPLHFGNFGGLPLKIVYCILGLTPGFLSVSGFVLWRKKRRR